MAFNLQDPLCATKAAAAQAMQAGNRGIVFIAVFDLVKAALFLLASAGVFHLVNRDTYVELTRLLHVFRFSGDHAFIQQALLKANLITDPDKRILTGVLLLYTAMYIVEGVGLLLRKRWAEYFAVLMTAVPLPFEVWTLLHHAASSPSNGVLPHNQATPSLLHREVFVLKCLVLFINAGIVWYLVHHLRRREAPQRTASTSVVPSTLSRSR